MIAVLSARHAGQLLLAGVLAAGCQAGDAAAPPARTGTPSAAATAGSPSPAPLTSVRISLDDTARAGGRTLFTVPVGTGTAQLGVTSGNGELNPLLPAAFLLDRTGAWVLDPVKRRLVRYDLTGRYLGQVLGVSPVADDIAPLPDGRILISDDPSDRSRLRVLTPGSHNGLPGTLYPAIDVHGDGPDGSPETLFRLAWASGTTGVWTSAGMRPLTAGLTLDRQSTSLSLPAGGILTATSSGDADWSFTDGRRSWQVTFTSRTDPSPIVTIETLQEHAGSLYLWVSRGSADVAPAAGGSPRFLVILPATGAPRAVPVADTNQVFEDANVHRHFNVTGDGRVVQMLIRRHQVLFTRLPT